MFFPTIHALKLNSIPHFNERLFSRFFAEKKARNSKSPDHLADVPQCRHVNLEQFPGVIGADSDREDVTILDRAKVVPVDLLRRKARVVAPGQRVALKNTASLTPGVQSLPEKVLKLRQMNMPQRSFSSSAARE